MFDSKFFKIIFNKKNYVNEKLKDKSDNIFAINREFFDMYTVRRQVSATDVISRVKVLGNDKIVNFLAILYNKTKLFNKFVLKNEQKTTLGQLKKFFNSSIIKLRHCGTDIRFIKNARSSNYKCPS